MQYLINEDSKEEAITKAKELLAEDMVEEEFIEDAPDSFTAKAKKVGWLKPFLLKFMGVYIWKQKKRLKKR